MDRKRFAPRDGELGGRAVGDQENLPVWGWPTASETTLTGNADKISQEAHQKPELPSPTTLLAGSPCGGPAGGVLGDAVDSATVNARLRTARTLAVYSRLESTRSSAQRSTCGPRHPHRRPAGLVHRVLRDERLLLERDRSDRIAFEARRRNEYLDLLPVRARPNNRTSKERQD
jgi:hypothetical protein